MAILEVERNSRMEKLTLLCVPLYRCGESAGEPCRSNQHYCFSEANQK